MATAYHSKTQKLYKTRLRVLESELPYYCTQYFNAKTRVLEMQSQYAYAVDLKVFFDFLTKHLDEYNDVPLKNIPVEVFNTLTSHDIDDYVDYLDSYDFEGDHRHNGELGIQRKLSSVKSLCKYLVKEEIISKNPAELVEMPKIHTKEIIILSKQDVKKLQDTILNENGMNEYQKKHNAKTKYRDYAIMKLFLGTGLRISELVGLDLNDINFKKNSARVIRKGGNEQHVYFSNQVADAIKRYLGTGAYLESGTRASLQPEPNEKALFISRKKKRLTVRAVQKLIEKYSKLAFGEDAEVKLHAHIFRKTYGSNLYMQTNNIKLVADTLGHNSISTTQKHYATSTDEYKMQAAIDII